ncbi:MAG: bifunctional 3-deoxy-7-phosphoheptulonate synthase/chorismate mutase type II [Muribaculaceae bacterium]|nr:bifunctional 3-deoxy-7-phosphoheptulonate synthase/chorismate mutase type II [Muribaculaceae bacterium]
MNPLSDLAENPFPKPLLIAGPCSAESEEQVLAAARGVAAAGCAVFRAGLWKPRTHPGGFEGVGEAALPWLRRAKAETGLPTATEVATGIHVAAALDGGVDFLWIGARTTANTFAVQEIADAIAASGRNDVAVLVKNPVSPDVELWLGALQRLERAGVRRLAAVHRGFPSAGATAYRNEPQWQIPMELKRRCPTLPVLVDPSHIGGRREAVPTLAQQAMDMGFDGLMIEVHPAPDQALSDAAQQITPAALRTLLTHLTVRVGTGCDHELAVLRQLIDQCDHEVLAALARRMEVVRRIGQLKRESNMAIVQNQRFSQVIASRLEMARELGLDTQFVNDLMQLIHQEAVAQQL